MEVAIGSVVIGARARKDMGDLDSLADSIRDTGGPLHPPVVRRDGTQFVLVCGHRRIEAMKKLGYDRIEVRVAASLTDELTALRAERDENTQRKEFLPSEAVAVAERIEIVERAKAKERQAEAGRTKAASPNLKEPRHARESSTRTAKAVGMGRTTLAKAKEVVETAADETLPTEVREAAQEAVAEMDRTGKVDRSHQKVKLIRAWADAVERFPFLDGVPTEEQQRMLAGATQLTTMVGREYERRLDAFQKHAEGLKRRNPETEAVRRSMARARKDAASLAVALADVERLVASVLDHPEVVGEYPTIGRGWSESIDACRAALSQLEDVTKPQLRRIK